MNNITLLGRLTKDPIIENSNSTDYTRFSIAVDRDKQDEVDFVNCVAFGKLATALVNNCKKGRQLLVNGRLQITQKDKKSYHSVISNKITFLQRPK